MKAFLLVLALAVNISAQNVKEGKGITNWTPVAIAPDVTKQAEGGKLDPDVRIEGSGRMEMSFANVKRSGDTFKGWVRLVFPDSAIVLEGKWNEVRFYTVCDCHTNVVRALTGIAYGLDGTIRAEESAQVLEHTRPGSIGRELFEFFCERGGPPTETPRLKTKKPE